jgi:eukaryotic-like serine/threonine-protein kinase
MEKPAPTANSENLEPDRWQRLKEILADALERDTPAARTAVVAERCGQDESLLKEAEALLLEAETLLQSPTDTIEECAEDAANEIPRDETSEIGARIGAYVLIRELGHGGMGTVYLAARADGYF